MSDLRGEWVVVIFSGGPGGDAIHSLRTNYEATAREIVIWFEKLHIKAMYTDDPGDSDDPDDSD